MSDFLMLLARRAVSAPALRARAPSRFEGGVQGPHGAPHVDPARDEMPATVAPPIASERAPGGPVSIDATTRPPLAPPRRAPGPAPLSVDASADPGAAPSPASVVPKTSLAMPLVRSASALQAVLESVEPVLSAAPAKATAVLVKPALDEHREQHEQRTMQPSTSATILTHTRHVLNQPVERLPAAPPVAATPAQQGNAPTSDTARAQAGAGVDPAPPAVEIHIGSIEVHAAAAPVSSARQPAASAPAGKSLDDYLHERSGPARGRLP
ncbi:hypothetical protein [Massilia sp. TWP1-3-3]|uniref:hypothetical protein n=1 Tax=Massilia sp. TWP1-3-3 TaxID=2804573 RepID=UPI003CE817C4